MNKIFSRYNHLFENKEKKFVYNTLSNSMIEVGDDLFCKLMQEKKGEPIINNELNNYPTLDEMLIISTPSQELDALNNIKLRNLMYRFDKSIMSLTIAPTSFCNFKCTYCYEESRPPVFMDNDTEDKLLNFITQHDSLKNLSIMWFGGEPLLNFKRIQSITQRILKENYAYSAGIITNGYLLNKHVVDKLEDLKIRYVQITVDGLEKTHNSRRPHQKRDDSFQKIVKNVEVLLQKELPLQLNLRINIDKDNQSEFPLLTEFLRDRFHFKNLIITPAFVSDNTDVNGCVNHCIFNRKEKSIFKLKHQQNHEIKFYPNLQDLDCMARQINSFLVNADGGLYKCYNDIGVKSKEIANLHSIGINAELLTSYMVGADFYSDANCKNCDIFPVCNGGCPYVRIANELAENKEENCHIMKDFELEFLLAHLAKKNN